MIKNNDIGLDWTYAGGSLNNKPKYIHWISEDTKLEPITAARGLVIFVSDEGKKFAETLPNVYNHEVSELKLMPIDPFLKDDISSTFLMDYLCDSVRDLHKKIMFKYGLMDKICNKIVNRGHMWSKKLRHELRHIKDKDLEFLCIVESCGLHTSRKTSKRFPLINFNIPGGKIEQEEFGRSASSFDFITQNMSRELREEIGLVFTKTNILSEDYQIKMRHKYQIDCPLIIRMDKSWSETRIIHANRRRSRYTNQPFGTAVSVILI